MSLCWNVFTETKESYGYERDCSDTGFSVSRKVFGSARRRIFNGVYRNLLKKGAARRMGAVPEGLADAARQQSDIHYARSKGRQVASSCSGK